MRPHRGAPRLPHVLAILPVFAAVAASAGATAIDYYGLGARAAAMGTGGTALADGLSALLVNPALMVIAPEGRCIGLLGAADLLHITLDPRPGPQYDILESIYQSSVARTTSGQAVNRPLATVDLLNPRSDTTDVPNTFGFHLGLIESFGVEDLRIGVAVAMPLEVVQAASPHYSDEREQYFSNRLHFARFGEAPAGQLVLAGAAYRVGPVSFGVSSTFDATADTVSRIYIPEGSVQTYSMITADIAVRSRFRYTVGVAVTPIEGLVVGLAEREPTFMEATGEGRLQLWNFDEYPEDEREIIQPYRFVLGYHPRQVSLGVAYGDADWTAHASATWEEWSEYLDAHGERPSPAFEDRISVRVGGEWTYLPRLAARLGFAWLPSPVPPQTGRSNYADGDLYAFTAGHGFTIGLLGGALRIDLAAQGWYMAPRRVHKDPAAIRDEFPDDATDLRTGAPIPEAAGLQTNNPGFPGWEAGGWVLAGGLTATWTR